MKKRSLRAVAILLLLVFVFSSPTLKVSATSEASEAFKGNISGESVNTGSEKVATDNDEIKISSRIYELIFGTDKASNNKNIHLIPGGEVLGIRIKEDYVTVLSSATGSALRRGDKIIKINGEDIDSAADVSEVLNKCGGNTVRIEVLRGREKITVTTTPTLDNGEYRLGITLRNMTSGIGTVTFIEPKSMLFGGLGHGVCDSETGSVLEVEWGEVCSVTLGGVSRGEIGKPGELSGVLGKKHFGDVYKNCECGIFGRLENYSIDDRDAVPIGTKSELKLGEAEIISTVKNGKKASYKIEITDIDYNSNGSKSFKIRVTDSMLIAITGGIVRGMSGSPIIQNGKLVGAVTHVLVANPTEGYGIFIENMLEAAQQGVQPKAA